MNTSRKLRTLVLLALLLSLTSIDTGLAKSKKKKAVPTGTPVLWQRPQDISARDLYLGPGGTAMRPDLRRITFIEEEKGVTRRSSRCVTAPVARGWRRSEKKLNQKPPR